MNSTPSGTIASNHGSGPGPVAVLFVLSVLLFMPSIARFVLGASSLTAGLIAACLLIGLGGVIGLYRFVGGAYWNATLVLVTCIAFAVLLHSMVAYLWFPISMGRTAGSLASIVVVVLLAYQVRTILKETAPGTLNRVLLIISILFLVIAVLAIAGIQPPLASALTRPVFPFNEPSHFAISFAPFLLYQCVGARLPVKLGWLGAAMVLAYLLRNLSLVVAVAITAICCLSVPLLVAGLFVIAVVIQRLDISYFTDRLDFSAETTNLSTLVYIQGVELVEAALRATSGWGIGFQQLGIAPLNTPTSDLIYRLTNDDANVRDGGFLAAKLIAEFGMLGTVVAIAYVYVAGRAVLALRRHSHDVGHAQPLELLTLSLIAAFSIEMFVRGVGYYSGEAMLLITALLLAAEHGFLRRASSSRVDQCPA